MTHSRSHAEDNTSRKRKLEPPPLEVGQSVKAHCPDSPKRYWFQGVVYRINEDGTVAIHYDDGDTQDRVLRNDVRPSKPKAPPPSPLGRSDPTRREVFTPIRLEGSVLRQPLYGRNGYAARQAQEREKCVSPTDVTVEVLDDWDDDGVEEEEVEAEAEAEAEVEAEVAAAEAEAEVACMLWLVDWAFDVFEPVRAQGEG